MKYLIIMDSGLVLLVLGVTAVIIYLVGYYDK